MHSITDPWAMQVWSQDQRREGLRIGLVPTMGYLHAGHLSLVELARQQADLVVVSLFVNPTQFGPDEDFGTYPRDVAGDSQRCRDAGVDVLFMPAARSVYAPDATISVIERGLSASLCGRSRPGHFDGVVTVVTKLFNMVLPDMAVFGEKDAQQLAIIRRLVRDLNVPVQILSGPIVREPDGLAMSSRNRTLGDAHRRQAAALYASLQDVQAAARQAPLRASICREMIVMHLAEQAPAFELEYVVLCDGRSLAAQEITQSGTLIALAGRLGSTRLIDNVVV
jgi:pantoate--beta-alanine ligase